MSTLKFQHHDQKVMLEPPNERNRRSPAKESGPHVERVGKPNGDGFLPYMENQGVLFCWQLKCSTGTLYQKEEGREVWARHERQTSRAKGTAIRGLVYLGPCPQTQSQSPQLWKTIEVLDPNARPPLVAVETHISTSDASQLQPKQAESPATAKRARKSSGSRPQVVHAWPSAKGKCRTPTKTAPSRHSPFLWGRPGFGWLLLRGPRETNMERLVPGNVA